MKPEEMQELREFVDNLAKGRTENKSCTVLTGKTVIEVPADMLNEFDDFLDDRINRMVMREVIPAQQDEEYENNKGNAQQLFLYTFAKSYEAFYYVIAGREPEFKFHMMEALEWEGQDDFAPSCVQHKIVAVEPTMCTIASLTYNFVKEKGYVDQPLNKWMYEYLFSAAHLAKQYMLEQTCNI